MGFAWWLVLASVGEVVWILGVFWSFLKAFALCLLLVTPLIAECVFLLLEEMLIMHEDRLLGWQQPSASDR